MSTSSQQKIEWDLAYRLFLMLYNREILPKRAVEISKNILVLLPENSDGGNITKGLKKIMSDYPEVASIASKHYNNSEKEETKDKIFLIQQKLLSHINDRSNSYSPNQQSPRT